MKNTNEIELCGVCGEPDCNMTCFCPECGPDGCDCHGERETEEPLSKDDQEAFEHAMSRND